ncbi:MAG: anti-sigma factor antagonist [Clostridia bacterium]|nr:anti-sigma factor antagonist [Clostridia bacterium]
MEISCKRTGATLIVTLQGELDHHNAAYVREELDGRLFHAGTKNLVFDLSGLKFMDSSGLGILIGRYKAVSAMGGHTRIASPSKQADRLIRLAGIHKIISVWNSVDEAVSGI